MLCGQFPSKISTLTHWGRVTHICVSELTIIGSDNGLSPVRRHAIIWTNAGILLIGPLGTNFNEIFNRNSYNFIEENAFENVVWKWRPFCLDLNVLSYVSMTDQSTEVVDIALLDTHLPFAIAILLPVDGIDLNILSHKTSYRKCLEAVRYAFWIVRWLWHLTGISPAVLPI